MKKQLKLCTRLVVVILTIAGCSENQEMRTPKIVEWIEIDQNAKFAGSRYPGVVSAGEQVAIGFNIGGRIVSISRDIGQSFQRGQVLARLDAREQRLAASEIRASISRASARLRQADADLRRAQKLIGTGAISQSEFDAARSARDVASADAQGLNASLRSALKIVSDANIYAPYSGTVVRKIANQAEVVAPNQPVLEIQSSEQSREVEIIVSQDLIGNVSAGQPVEIEATGANREQFTGTVKYVGTQTQGGGGYPVKLSINNAPSTVKNGMAVEVTLNMPMTSKRSGTFIPASAILSGKGNEHRILTVDPKTKKTKLRKIKIERLSRDGAIISSSLQEGTIILTKGATYVEPGEEVSLMDRKVRRFAE